jgi:hypothetical protein
LKEGVEFVLGFAASAFAIHAEIPAETQAVTAKGASQITIGGEIRFRGDYQNNNTDFNKDLGDYKQYYDSRIRLSVDAQVTPNTEGFIQVEAGSDVDGNKSSDVFVWGNSTKDPNNPGTGSSNASGIYNVGDAKRGTFSVLQGWILYKGSGLLGVPAGVKIGHMPLALGNSLFFDHTKYGDDAIVVFADPMKELHISLLAIKFREGNLSFSDDADGYVALGVYNFDKNSSVSGDATFVNDQTGAPVGGTHATSFPIHFWNFGLRGNTNISGFGLKADGELQAGKIDHTATALRGDLKFNGYAFLFGANYKLEPVMLGLDFAYGSGPKDTTHEDKLGSFVTSQSAIQHYTYVYDYRTVNACGQQYGGLCNTWYVKLSADADLMKDLRANVSGYWLNAVKDNKVALANGTSTTGTSKKIGLELDANVQYKIDRNLTYWVEGGYLFAEGFFDTVTPTGVHGSSNAYSVRHGIQLSF